MKFLQILLLILFASGLKSQILEQETKILQKSGGEPIYLLKEGQSIYSSNAIDGWYKVRKTAYVTKDALLDEKYLEEGTKLYNEEGIVIGEVLARTKVNDYRLLRAFRQEDRYVVNLPGYVFKTRFQNNSMPEERISALLAVKNRNEQLQGLSELYVQYNFQKRQFGEFIAYSFSDPNASSDEKNDFRLTVVMRGESTVYAVISNDHKIAVDRIKDSFEEGPYQIIYLYKPSPNYKKLIEEDILYTFVAL